ncbi:hypothetical protein ACQ4WX_07150 [Streptomyces lasalocidi]
MTTTPTDTTEARAWSDLRALTARLLAREPAEIHALRTGALPHRPGSYGQYFTAWDLANGILRDYSMNLYQALRMVAHQEIGVHSALAVLRSWVPMYGEFLRYSGFEQLADHARLMVESGVRDHRGLVTALSAFVAYVNRLTAWSHHYFPWHVGEAYRYDAAPPDVMAQPLPAACDEGSSVRTPVRLRWEPLGVEVVAEVCRDLNERLCDDFLAALPFTVLQDHAVVTGESMYAWTPLVSVAPTPVTERIRGAPVGRLRFSQATGNKLVVQYGPTTETLHAPVLGRVVAEDVDALRQVGRAAWDSNFRTKEHMWLTVERI